MTKMDALIEEIKNAPESVQQEVFDFVMSLKKKRGGRIENSEGLLTLAQTSWAEDWNTPEEDDAWRDL